MNVKLNSYINIRERSRLAAIVCVLALSSMLGACSSSSKDYVDFVEGEDAPTSVQARNDAKLVLSQYLVSENKIVSEQIGFPFVGKNLITVFESEKDFYSDSSLFSEIYDPKTVGVNYLYYVGPNLKEFVPLSEKAASFAALEYGFKNKFSQIEVIREHKDGFFVIELISNVQDVRARTILQNAKTLKIIAEF